jgi:hypothetical protein
MEADHASRIPQLAATLVSGGRRNGPDHPVGWDGSEIGTVPGFCGHRGVTPQLRPRCGD